MLRTNNCTSPRVSKGDIRPPASNVSPLLTRGLWHLTLILFIFSCSLFAAYAQSGGIKGKVRNMNGDGIPSVEVTARLNGKDVRTVKSSNKGDFSIAGLEEGLYNVSFEARGYSFAIKYNVEVKAGKMKDLGDRLIMTVDRGTRVIVKGSVFFKDGFIAAGAKVVAERVNGDGSVKKLGETTTNIEGEFTLGQPEGAAKIRFTATFKDGKAVKEIDVDSAMVYRTALNLDIDRPKPD